MYKEPQKFTISIRAISSVQDPLKDRDIPEFFGQELRRSFDYRRYEWERMTAQQPEIMAVLQEALEHIQDFLEESGAMEQDAFYDMLEAQEIPSFWQDELEEGDDEDDLF